MALTMSSFKVVSTNKHFRSSVVTATGRCTGNVSPQEQSPGPLHQLLILLFGPQRFVKSSTISRRSHSKPAIVCALSQSEGTKTIVVKNVDGELPLPYSEKDPYKLPVAIYRVQQYLLGLGWEKAWVEQIVDRIMKGMLRTTEERAKGVVDALLSTGLKSDEICNMASISVVLLGLNPETRVMSVVEYLKARGVPAAAVPDLVLKHPRIFEYKVSEDGHVLVKGQARIQVDVVPVPPSMEKAIAVNYFREGASFLEAPVSPVPPMPTH